MAYIGNPPAPQNITSSEITDGTIVNVDIASDAAIAATKIAGLATVATTGAYGDLSGTPSLVASLADLGVTASAADLNTTDVTTLGTVEASKVVTADANGDVKFPDGDKAIFGAGDDLQIYHDGSNSYIKDAGTGNLVLQSDFLGVHVQSSSGENMAQFNINDAVKLYFDSVKKLETTATGIDVTGNATFGDNDKAIFGAGSDLQIYHSGNDSFISDTGTGGLFVRSSSALKLQAASGENYAVMTENGSVQLYYNNSAKFSTTTTGVDVTGELIADSYNETYAALSGTSPTVNCHAGNAFSLVLSGATTFTFTNPPASGTAYTFSVEIIQDSGGSGHTVTWPSSVDWPAATAPTLTATASAKDIFVFTTRDGGSNWYGFTAGQALA